MHDFLPSSFLRSSLSPRDPDLTASVSPSVPTLSRATDQPGHTEVTLSRAPDQTGHTRTQTHARKNVRVTPMSECQKGCRIDARIDARENSTKKVRSQNTCRIEWQKGRHKECQNRCQVECQKECQNSCRKECQIECQNRCQKESQIECQGLCPKECQLSLGTHGPNPMTSSRSVYAHKDPNTCQKECPSYRMSECQKGCQIECQKRFQIESRTGCQTNLSVRGSLEVK